jgi:altronate dehydratase
MSAICEEARTYAKHCESCGQFTTAAKLRAMADWIDIQQSTIIQQRKQISEMQEQTAGFKMKFKGGANQTSYSKKEPA